MNPLNRYAAIVIWAVLTCAGATGALGQADSRKPDTEWRGYNGGYDATRFSPLTQIDTGTVAGLRRAWVKDESQMPTGSFKARGMAVAVSRARELGVKRVAAPSAGNAGGALATFAARAGRGWSPCRPKAAPRSSAPSTPAPKKPPPGRTPRPPLPACASPLPSATA